MPFLLGKAVDDAFPVIQTGISALAMVQLGILTKLVNA